LPFYKSQKGFLGHVLGGYQASGTWRYSTGQLWTPAEDAFTNSSCQNSFDNSFFSGASACRPFDGNRAAAVNTAGICTDATLADCGLQVYSAGASTGVPTTASAVRWILNDDTSAAFFKTPYGNSGRNPNVRGDNVSAVNLSLFKSIKFTERLSLRLEAQAYNLFNHRFLGIPDPFMSDSTFADNHINNSGGDYTNVTLAGIGRRRLILGGKFNF